MQNEGIASNAIYTMNDIAKLLNISKETVRQLAKKNEIPHVMLGSRYRFCGWQLKAWLDERMKKSI